MPGTKVTYAVSILTFSSALLVYSKAGITEFFLPPTNAWSTRFQEDIREITIEAEQGNAFAQFDLGVMYEQGRGVQQDDRAAVEWYRKSAEQGHAGAQYNLGVMYERGRGVQQDDQAAVKWYRKSAEQGDADAQYNLGVMYEQGRGVEPTRYVLVVFVILALALIINRNR